MANDVDLHPEADIGNHDRVDVIVGDVLFIGNHADADFLSDGGDHTFLTANLHDGFDFHVFALQRRFKGTASQRARLAPDHLLPGQIRQTHPPTLAPLVRFGDDDDGLRVAVLECQELGVVFMPADDPDVQSIVNDALENLPRIPEVNGNFDARILVVKNGENLGRLVRADGADFQVSGLEIVDRLEKFHGILLIADDPVRDGQQGSAGFRQLHAAAVAPEQFHAIGRFQVTDLAGQGRLTDTQHLCCRRETAFAGDGVEGTHL